MIITMLILFKGKIPDLKTYRVMFFVTPLCITKGMPFLCLKTALSSGEFSKITCYELKALMIRYLNITYPGIEIAPAVGPRPFVLVEPTEVPASRLAAAVIPRQNIGICGI